MYEQNVTLRKHALGKFRPFLLDMSKDTAMLVWLDSNRNVKGAPNENYAREVMELFSLGVGNYTEKDIQEAARAFTGWHHDAEVNEVRVQPRPARRRREDRLRQDRQVDRRRHRPASAATSDACAKFLVGKLYTFLVSETAPPQGLLDPLVDAVPQVGLRHRGTGAARCSRRGCSSREHAYRKRVKWPVEYAVGAVRRGRVRPRAAGRPGRSAREDGAGRCSRRRT